MVRLCFRRPADEAAAGKGNVGESGKMECKMRSGHREQNLVEESRWLKAIWGEFRCAKFNLTVTSVVS